MLPRSEAHTPNVFTDWQLSFSGAVTVASNGHRCTLQLRDALQHAGSPFSDGWILVRHQRHDVLREPLVSPKKNIPRRVPVDEAVNSSGTEGDHFLTVILTKAHHESTF